MLNRDLGTSAPRLALGLLAAIALGVGTATIGERHASADGGAAPPAARQSALQQGGAQQGGAPTAGGRQGGPGEGSTPTAPLISAGASAARFPKNADEFDQMFNQVKTGDAGARTINSARRT